jgi:hypothetical protein
MLHRSFLLILAAPLLLSPSASSCRDTELPQPPKLSRSELGRLINELSEEGGYFWSNNFISNETSYLHALQPLDAMAMSGGVYVGVGPNQNFTYIAELRPRMAFVIDIRRQNMLEHLIFKLLTVKAETRLEYLSFLTGRPVHRQLPSRDLSLVELVEIIENTAPDPEFARQLSSEMTATLRTWPDLNLGPGDFQDVERIYLEFSRQGLDIKYDSWRSFFFPTLKEFLLETDLEGVQRNWLATAESYQFVRSMQLANLIVPLVGDFAGKGVFRRLGRLLRGSRDTVSVFYVSNVEFYLFRQRKWRHFVDNVKQLPIDDRSIFIRAYANLHRPHPQMVGDHITVTLVQNVEAFLNNADEGRYRSLWDVVTVDYAH